MTRLPRLISSILFLLTFGTSAAAKTTALFFVGADGSESSIFREHIQLGAQFAKRKQWSAEYFVETKHPSIAKLASQEPALKNVPLGTFTVDAFNDRMDKLIDDVNCDNSDRRDLRRRHPAGDQILIVVDAHGAEPDATTNTNLIGAADGMFDPTSKLAAVAKAANQCGVKISFVFGNCYSGTSLLRLMNMIGNENCVISAGAPHRETTTGPLAVLISSMALRENLEEAFLHSNLLNEDFRGSPMISTRAGLQAQKDLQVFDDFFFSKAEREKITVDRCSVAEEQKKVNQLIGRAREIDRALGNSWISWWRGRNETIAERLRARIQVRNRDSIALKAQSNEEVTFFNACKRAEWPKGTNIDFACKDYFASAVVLEELGNAFEDFKRSGDAPEKMRTVTIGGEPTDLSGAAIVGIVKRAKELEASAGKDVRRLAVAAVKGVAWRLSAYKGRVDIDGFPENAKFTGLSESRELYGAFYQYYSKKFEAQKPAPPNACRDFKL